MDVSTFHLQFEFNKETGNRAEYFPEDNSITLSLYNKKEGEKSAASDTAHECGHAIEYKAKEGLRILLKDFYESITKKDKDGNVVYSLTEDGIMEEDEGHRFRELTIPIPDQYIRKEYLDESNNLDGTELLSEYVELMYSKPWLRTDSRYHEYFEGVERCLRQSSGTNDEVTANGKEND